MEVCMSCQPQIYAKLQPDKIFPFKCDATNLEILATTGTI